MTLVIILNAILCGAVIVGVVAPLVWAIFTQHRDQPVVIASARGTRRELAYAARRTRHQRYEPIVWPAR